MLTISYLGELNKTRASVCVLHASANLQYTSSS